MRVKFLYRRNRYKQPLTGASKRIEKAIRSFLKPLAEKPCDRSYRLVDSLHILEGRLSDPAMIFLHEDIYGSDAR
jgi:hypothetical protein